MLTIRIEKFYTYIMGYISPDLEITLRNTLEVTVPNWWLAKKKMEEKASKLIREGKTGEGNRLRKQAQEWNGKKKFIYKRGTNFSVPTGLCNMLFETLNLNNIPYTIHDNRKFLPYTSGDITLNSITLYPYQQQAIKVMAKKGCGILHAATSSGKTEIIAGLIKKYDIPPTLFLTHRNILETQSANRLSDRLGIEIGIVSGKTFDPKQVTVAMVPTLYNKLKENNGTYINLIERSKLIIGDEIHLGSSDSWLTIFKTAKTCNVWGCSGTPIKNNIIDDLVLISNIGPEIFKITAKWLIDNGYITPPVINIVPIRHNPTGSSYNEITRECIIENETRHDIIKRIVISDLDRLTLILVNQIDHATNLLRYLEEYGAEMIHSKIGKSAVQTKKIVEETVERFRNKELKILISTPLLDMGVDIPGIDRLILGSGSGKSIVSILQRIGRSLRKSEGKLVAEVYDLFDIEKEYLNEHLKERLAIYADESQQFTLKLSPIR
jgi:superfamily II DNA or RNA helicase